MQVSALIFGLEFHWEHYLGSQLSYLLRTMRRVTYPSHGCSWAFDTKYDRSTAANYPISNDVFFVSFANSLNLDGDGTHKTSYSMYRIWLASISLHCGWEVECEMLRIFENAWNHHVLEHKRTRMRLELLRGGGGG